MNGIYTIYAYYNQAEIQAILNAIVGMLGAGGVNGDYLSLVRVAALLGIFVSTAWGFARARGEDAAQYVVVVALFYSTLLVPRVTVWVEDHSVGHQAPVSVDNVPLGLAFFASTTSHIGFWLTEKMETFFALPSASLKISESGLMGGSRTLRMAQGATIRNPVLAQDMAMFMRDCVNPELTLQPSAIATLQSATNLWEKLNNPPNWLINPGRMVVLNSAGGAPVDCSTGYTSIGTLLVAETTQQTSELGQALFPHLSTATANIHLASLLPGAESLIMTASASAQDAIKQRLIVNLMSETSMTMGQMMNDPAAIQRATALAMATESANSSYGVMAKMAQETLPIVRNAFELVILGVFPIIVLLVIIAGPKGGALLRSYVMTMIWVQLWAPLYAIVNYVATMHVARQMKAALAGIDGVALVNAADVVNTSIAGDAVAGILSVMVPMIALAIVKGGEVAAAGLASGMMAPAQSAAGSAGAAVGTGNIQFGNTSWANHTANNTRANQHSSSFGYVSPDRGTVQTPHGTMVARPGQDGMKALIVDTPTGPMSIQSTGGQTTTASKSSGSTGSTIEGVGATRTTGVGTSLDHARQAAAERAVGNHVLQEIARQHGAQVAKNAKDAIVTTRGSQAEKAETTTTTTSFEGGAQVGARGDTGEVGGKPQPQAKGNSGQPADTGQTPSARVGASLSIGANKKNAHADAESNKVTNGTQLQREAAETYAKSQQVVDSLKAGTNDQQTKKSLDNWMASLAKGLDAKYQTNYSAQLTKHASEEKRTQDSAGVNMSQNLTGDYFAAATQVTGSPQAAMTAIATNDPKVSQAALQKVMASRQSNQSPDGSVVARPTETSGQIFQQGQEKALHHDAENRGRVAAEHGKNAAIVGGKQVADPNTATGASTVTANLNGEKATIEGNVDGQTATTGLGGGIQAAAVGLAMREQGLGDQVRRIANGGADIVRSVGALVGVTPAPQETTALAAKYSGKLEALARDPEKARYLSSIKGEATPEQLDRIEKWIQPDNLINVSYPVPDKK